MITAEIEDSEAQIIPEAISNRWGKPPYNWVETRCFLMGLFLGLSTSRKAQQADECLFLYSLAKFRESLN